MSLKSVVQTITVVAEKPAHGEVVLALSPTDTAFEKQEAAYVKATDYRTGLMGAITKSVATEAKSQFEDEEVQVVTGSLSFGPTELSATVYRTFEVEDSGDTISNHVVVSSVDDFTNIVNDSLVGIFDDAEADTEEK